MDYKEDEERVVREILKKKDYYEILGVERGCSVEDVRKAYKKLALKVHPDKNNAPGAEEAFKLLSKAFQCLGNEESMRKYDLSRSGEPVRRTRTSSHGSGEPVSRTRTSSHAATGQGFNGFYQGEEEKFTNFSFKGTRGTPFRGFNFDTATETRQRTPNNGSTGGSGLSTLVDYLLPVILVLLVSFWSSGYGDPPTLSPHQSDVSTSSPHHSYLHPLNYSHLVYL